MIPKYRIAIDILQVAVEFCKRNAPALNLISEKHVLY